MKPGRLIMNLKLNSSACCYVWVINNGESQDAALCRNAYRYGVENSEWAIFAHFLERVAAVTSAKYCDMIRNELRSAIRTKRRVKDYLRLLCDAELRALGDVINSLQLLYCKIIAQPIYCPDLFGSLNSLLKSRCLREPSEENVGLVLLMCSPLIKITSYGSHCETCRPLG